tara:strand:+ start:121 stop:903 length:783 start_codon:yes stop_codon:yes gene_type:complete
MCDTKPENVKLKRCIDCSIEKAESEFRKKGKYRQGFCIHCANTKRRNKYKNNEALRQKCINNATAYKKNKKSIRDEEIFAHQQEIGIDNMECRYCCEIKHKSKFRWNRRKCRDCERDDPKEKFKRYVRTRIYNCLKVHKAKSHIEYLGSSTNEYLEWIMTYNNDYNLDNYGSIWHIDHVIALSQFDLSNEEQQLLAFNWRNTMPLSAKENLKKNNRIDKKQIQEHLKKLEQYHTEKKMKMPEKFENLYATYLDAGTSLET